MLWPGGQVQLELISVLKTSPSCSSCGRTRRGFPVFYKGNDSVSEKSLCGLLISWRSHFLIFHTEYRDPLHKPWRGHIFSQKSRTTKMPEETSRSHWLLFWCAVLILPMPHSAQLRSAWRGMVNEVVESKARWKRVNFTHRPCGCVTFVDNQPQLC